MGDTKQSEGVEGTKMKKNFTGIEFIDPKICIDWKLKEEDLISLLGCEKNESRFYTFEAKLSPVDIEVFNRIIFHDLGYKMEVIVTQTKVERDTNSKAIYIDENNTNTLKNYIDDKFGSPKFFSRLFSILNKPFYIHRWTFANLKVTHKYQDYAGGFFEWLIIDVKY